MPESYHSVQSMTGVFKRLFAPALECSSGNNAQAHHLVQAKGMNNLPETKSFYSSKKTSDEGPKGEAWTSTLNLLLTNQWVPEKEPASYLTTLKLKLGQNKQPVNYAQDNPVDLRC